jgi:hypothetical protein
MREETSSMADRRKYTKSTAPGGSSAPVCGVTGDRTRGRGGPGLVLLESRIRTIRGEKVMLDSDLADVYGVPTRALNQALRRNPERFPADFAFRLSEDEFSVLRSQIVISNLGRGGRRHPPWTFTEHGALMAASVLSSPRAVEMSVFVVRAFVRLRELARGHAKLATKLRQIERRVAAHDEDLAEILEAIRQLTCPTERSKRAIGFTRGGET